MNDSRIDNAAIRHFVRESLGCTCPDKVFDHIRVTGQPDLFVAATTLYEIGGRLCVAVSVPVDRHDIERNLGQMIQTGKDYRDRHGFNRFRLVVVTDDDSAKQELPVLFDAVPGNDDRTHLHVVDPRSVPRHVIAEAD